MVSFGRQRGQTYGKFEVVDSTARECHTKCVGVRRSEIRKLGLVDTVLIRRHKVRLVSMEDAKFTTEHNLTFA